MSNEVRKIREYKDSDRRTYFEIYDAAIPLAHPFLEENALLSQRQQAETLLNKPETKTFVLEENGQIVGFATFISETCMAGFFVDPTSQGVGLGRYLMEHVQSHKQTIELAVYEKNQKAVRFYRNNGFSQAAKNLDESTNQEFLVMVWDMQNNS